MLRLAAVTCLVGCFCIYVWYAAKIEREHSRAKAVTMDELVADCKNGDVLQFFSRLNGLGKFVWVPISKFLANSIWVHTAIVVEDPQEGKVVYTFSKAPSKSRKPIWRENEQMCQTSLRKFLELNMKHESHVMKIYRASEKVQAMDFKAAAKNFLGHRNFMTDFRFDFSRSSKLLHCGNFVGQMLEELHVFDKTGVNCPLWAYAPIPLSDRLVSEGGYSRPVLVEIRP